ncbi:MAG: LruC domain-containing protein, partial [Calditrichota bacterium]
AALPVQSERLQHRFNATPNRGFYHPKSPRSARIDELSHFPPPRNTGVNMSVIIERITGVRVVRGAELACLTPDSLVAGADTLSFTPPWGLAVWGDDNTTEEIDGFRAGEPLRFVYWDPGLRLELDAEMTVIEGAGTYTSNGFMVLGLHVDAPEGFAYLGGWNGLGRPDYLVDDLALDEAFTTELSRLLPEHVNIWDHHSYLDPAYEAVISFERDAEVYVSFLHDGTELPCALGYYIYPTDQPPRNPAAIDRLHIAFPNASFVDGGGGLRAGNRISLGTVEAGSTLSWFVIPGGWTGQEVSLGVFRFYANPEFNPEASPGLRKHFILLNNADRDRLILGCEIIRRDSSDADNDFNDLVFVIETDPPGAFQTGELAVFDANPSDRDGDNVINAMDNYPDDARRAFNYQFPLDDRITLAFEDEWPQAGDYDFNDLVVFCHYDITLDARGRAVYISTRTQIQAAGSTRHNGFGFSLPLPAAQVSQVTGSQLRAGFIQVSGNGTESGPENAVIIVFDDVLALMSPAAGYNTINTESGSPAVNQYELNIQVEFTAPIRLDSLGTPPFNPFLIINRNRGKELHPAGYPPTTQTDQNWFGQNDDRTVVGSGRFYKSRYNLPWIIILPRAWNHVFEGRELIQAYPNFGTWAESAGNSNRNWFSSNIQQEYIWTAP